MWKETSNQLSILHGFSIEVINYKGGPIFTVIVLIANMCYYLNLDEDWSFLIVEVMTHDIDSFRCEYCFIFFVFLLSNLSFLCGNSEFRRTWQFWTNGPKVVAPACASSYLLLELRCWLSPYICWSNICNAITTQAIFPATCLCLDVEIGFI